MQKLLWIWLLLMSSFVRAQDTLYIEPNTHLLNTSISPKFTLYASPEKMSIDAFFKLRGTLTSRKLKNKLENLDFTTGTYFIDFVLINRTGKDQQFVLEAARPITNEVDLYDGTGKLLGRSGDGIPFSSRSIQSNRSSHPIYLKDGETQHYVLKLSSDGEMLSLPITLWDRVSFDVQDRNRQFHYGIFYGVYLFVLVIYFNFYVLLRDRLFLLYSLYVFASGLLQFALDGYAYEYFFPAGGYFAQHQVVVIAGIATLFVLLYAEQYLELQGRIRKITMAFAALVVTTILVSLIPGKAYELSYPLINGFSLLSVVFLLVISLRIRRSNPNVSRLFLIGLSALLCGALLFILGNFSIINLPGPTQNALKLGSLIQIAFLSILMARKYKTLQEEKENAQRQLLIELEEKNQLAEQTNIRLELEVAARTQEIEKQRSLLKEKNEDIVASIKYAERIQKAVLSNEEKFKSILPDSFVMYQPKDIVSGDFFWIDRIQPNEHWSQGLIVYATADCTGHGVPGAFVSIICNNLLKLGKTRSEVNNPGEALDFANSEINESLNSEFVREEIRDGMDIALCAIDPSTNILYFAGARNGVYIVRGKELIEVKGDRKSIGGLEDGKAERFSNQAIQLESGDILYTTSDGYLDQFGGPDGKKFNSKRFKELLLSIAGDPLNHQQSTLENTFDIWKDVQEQVDDVLVIGVRIS